MLGDLSDDQVVAIVEDCVDTSPLPYLTDDAVRSRAIEIARGQGIFDRLKDELTPDRPIGILPYTRLRDYQRNGNRTRYEAVQRWRDGQIEMAAMACWLGLDYVDYLQDLLWAECEATTWVMPAHEHPDRPIDLRAAICAEKYATIVTLLADRLADEVRSRVTDEICQRVLDAFVDEYTDHWWRTGSNNWNAVCHAGVCVSAMLVDHDLDRLRRIIFESLNELRVFLDGFTDDGGCSEGLGYWRFGFGHYAHLAAALHDFTGGRIDIMGGEKIERICRYPLAATVAPGQELAFADAHSGYLSPATAFEINRFCAADELFGLCRMDADGRLQVETLRELMLCDGRARTPLTDLADAYLADLAVVKLRRGPVTIGAKGGHNAEHHNHNDLGSFVVHRGRTFFLCDPGAPIYSRATFSAEERYESVFCNSFGHSVPVIDAQGQPTGEEYTAEMTVAGHVVRIELAGAYDAPALSQLTRTIELTEVGETIVSDEFVFDQVPGELVEAFMTFQPAEPIDGGAAVRITSDADGTAELRAEGIDGVFGVTELTEESARESRGGGVLRRISFTPAALTERMTLRFVVRWT